MVFCFLPLSASGEGAGGRGHIAATHPQPLPARGEGAKKKLLLDYAVEYGFVIGAFFIARDGDNE